MFETAVRADSEIAITTANGQQNAAILGNGCALFLAKFLAKMVCKYNKLCSDSFYDCHSAINKSVFKLALEQNLLDLSVEDLMEHGRLLLLKEKLVSMIDPVDKLDIKTLGLFQLKDFSRGDAQRELAISQNIKDVHLTSQDAITAMDYR